MQEEINKFIRHTITNLEGALEKQDDKLTWAVLTNLADTIDSYIEPLELSVLCDTLAGQEKNGTA
ncbi:hypothetical protein UFOVP359_14 [uncultured Caudovirales phage]|uniref:Uncharacterized protein n=1 Tax=uncultured Caudovirales phage TaxID=2100421 RepID=A0A6J7WXT6_9CAUD|nr:hypothetical protein UFOVP359_14 [uncultured Caudovirales phage]